MSSGGASYAAAEAPSSWVQRFAPLVAAGASVLDVACGYGRHSRFFAARGARVTAVDRDEAALATLAGVQGITILRADLEAAAWPFRGLSFDAIVVTRYLHRGLFPDLIDAVADSGVFLYETFAAGNEVYGKPSNPDFLLDPGELLDVVRGRLAIVAFEQGLVEGGAPAVIQRIAAIGVGFRWPPALPPG
jgi:SAM-dependent methyltransferase